MHQITARVTFEIKPATPGELCSDSPEPATHVVVRVHTSKNDKTTRHFEWAGPSQEACERRVEFLSARRRGHEKRLVG